MTAVPSYSTGTIQIDANATSVIGTGSNWTGQNAMPGDFLVAGGQTVIIQDVTDATHLAIDAWPFAAVASGSAYKIYKVSSQRFAGGVAMQSVSDMVAALETNGLYVFVGPAETVPDPSLGEDEQYALQATTGKLWQKVGGIWNFIGTQKGFGTPAPWNSATAYVVQDVVSLDGTSYVCIQANTNQTPPNATYWTVLAAKGDGATVSVGTVTTGAGGSAAAVTNVGTPGDAVFDFTIPQGEGYGGTSTTSLAIGTGAKAFTTQAGLAYTNGARVRASSAADTTVWMEGLATYAGTALTIAVDKTNGSGTFADWNLNVVGQPGAGDLTAANNLSDVGSAATALANLGGLAKSANLSDVANAGTALKNLGAPVVLSGYLSGLVLSTAGSSATFSVASGVAVDSTSADFMRLASSISKTTSAWASGSTNGALDTGGIANSTWYHVHLIKNPTSGAVDVLVSLSATAPTLPSGYTLFRRIGSMKTDASGHWIAFKQFGDDFLLVGRVSNLLQGATGTTAALQTLTVPTGIQVLAHISARIDSPTSSSMTTAITSPDGSDDAVSLTVFSMLQVANSFLASTLDVRTNTSGQIRHRSSVSGQLTIATIGWIDTRGRFGEP